MFLLLFRCVRSDLLADGQYEFIWKDSGSGVYTDFSAWKIKAVSPSQMSLNSFRSKTGHSSPACCPKLLLLSQLANGNDVAVLGNFFSLFHNLHTDYLIIMRN